MGRWDMAIISFYASTFYLPDHYMLLPNQINHLVFKFSIIMGNEFLLKKKSIFFFFHVRRQKPVLRRIQFCACSACLYLVANFEESIHMGDWENVYKYRVDEVVVSCRSSQLCLADNGAFRNWLIYAFACVWHQCMFTRLRERRQKSLIDR